MSKQKSLVSLIVGVSLLPATFLPGCKGGENNTQIDSSQAKQKINVDQQLKAIDDNPHMPSAAKAAAKASILQNANRRGVGP